MKACWWECIIYTHCLETAPKWNPVWTEINAWTVKTWQDPHPPVSCLTLMTSALLQQRASLSCQPSVRPASLMGQNLSQFWKDMCCGSIFILGKHSNTFANTFNYLSGSVREREQGVLFYWLGNQWDTDSGSNVSHLWADSWKLD